MEVSDTLGFLLGAWHLQRWLADGASGTAGTFTGTAEFLLRPDPVGTWPAGGGTAGYQERGELSVGAHTGPATRSLTCRRLAGAVMDVRFTDGREFYRLDLRPGHGRAEYRCGGDLYRVDVRVVAADLVEERWHVTGPRKDYQALARLSRLPGHTRGAGGHRGSG